MALISKVGTRSLKVRFLYGVIFTILGIGSITMIYPLLIMVSGAIKSDADYSRGTPLPNYLWNDDVLWTKYVQSKYTTLLAGQAVLRREFDNWWDLTPPTITDADRAAADEFRAFRAAGNWPLEWYTIGHAETARVLAKNGRTYRRAIQQRFGTLEEASRGLGFRMTSWSGVSMPLAAFTERRFLFPETPDLQVYCDVKAKLPPADWATCDLDATFAQAYCRSQWSKIKPYNKAHGTNLASYRDVLLSTTPPPESQKQSREDWEKFVRQELNVAFIRIDDSALPALRQFLSKKYFGKIDELNRLWESHFASFDDVVLPARIIDVERPQSDVAAFVKDAAACPLEALSIYGPRQGFEEFLAKKRGVAVSQIDAKSLPTEVVDYLDFQPQKASLRWEFATRNFTMVLSYILFQGNGVRNTIIFCGLAVLTNLLVNPLAAYALSRYKPPTAYTILLFCMCTMAFPSEVTMIPSFLLLKRFPLVPLFVGFGVSVLVTWILHKMAPKGSVLAKGIFGVGAGIAAGWWLAPVIGHRLLGTSPDGSISLLNTFWALVLPGMANGFSIFLLKGFFDSLPRELYEAADIDGANEWTKFWLITMNLSKPILAVLALGAFTAAYAEFLMALVIIPDPNMWTLMVWLYQMQASAHQTVVYASLVIAAIPTMLVFVLCQNVIMRGLVVPTEK